MISHIIPVFNAGFYQASDAPSMIIPITVMAMAIYLPFESFSFKNMRLHIMETTQYAEISGAESMAFAESANI